MKKVAKNTTAVVMVVAAILLTGEALCRLGGRPHGDFEVFFTDSRVLYPRNQTLTMSWGPIPYLVGTNNQGFRGEDFEISKDPAALRILTIGDSITDGFFVDNPSTWQFALQADLEGRLATNVEIINGARGGGSIDAELGMLRRFAPFVSPDLVILTFVSNDIAEISGTPRERLLQRSMSTGEMPTTQRIQRFVMTRTGLGEFLFHAYLTVRSPAYRQRPQQHELRFDDSRYAIAGGDDYAANTEMFRRRFSISDGHVLGEAFDEETELSFMNYRALLEEFAAQCKAANADLLFVYFPAYPQVYDTTSSRYINDRLRSACEELGIEFLDLSDGFIAEGAGRVLHLAPLDYHLNPEGNAVFARLVADHLTGDHPLGTRIKNGLAQTPTAPRALR